MSHRFFTSSFWCLGGITHDPSVFEDPEAFRPERWFKPELRDERTFDLMFGTGGVRVLQLGGSSSQLYPRLTQHRPFRTGCLP